MYILYLVLGYKGSSKFQVIRLQNKEYAYIWFVQLLLATAHQVYHSGFKLQPMQIWDNLLILIFYYVM
jgi:hypothetical protein